MVYIKILSNLCVMLFDWINLKVCDWALLLWKRRWNDCQRQFEALWSYDNRLFCLLLKNTTWEICGFNKTVPHATQLDRIWLYCKKHFLASNFSSWRLFCGATWKTMFMQINLQLLGTWKSTFVKLWLRYRPICVIKWSKIT